MNHIIKVYPNNPGFRGAKLAGLNKNPPKKIFPPQEEDDDRYDEYKEEKERQFKIDVDRHIMRGKLKKLQKRKLAQTTIICPKKLKEKIAAIGINFDKKPKTYMEKKDDEFRNEMSRHNQNLDNKNINDDSLRKDQAINSLAHKNIIKFSDAVDKQSAPNFKFREDRLPMGVGLGHVKIKKLQARLASLGEENMTYKKSKHMKILKKKNSEIRKAQSNIEDILRKNGRSVDGSHTRSSFLSQSGDFIGGDKNHSSHGDQINKILKTNIPAGDESDNQLHKFLTDNKLIRVQNFPINRAGERKISVDIRGKVNINQLKSIRELETDGHDVGFAVGFNASQDNDGITGRGSRDLVKALREKKFL